MKAAIKAWLVALWLCCHEMLHALYLADAKINGTEPGNNALSFIIIHHTSSQEILAMCS